MAEIIHNTRRNFLRAMPAAVGAGAFVAVGAGPAVARAPKAIGAPTTPASRPLRSAAWNWLCSFREIGGEMEIRGDVVWFGGSTEDARRALHDLDGPFRLEVTRQAAECIKHGVI